MKKLLSIALCALLFCACGGSKTQPKEESKTLPAETAVLKGKHAKLFKVAGDTYAVNLVKTDDDLQAGDNIEVTWLPNRRCVFRYEGNAHFLVTVAENAKLHVGDRFETSCFIIGKPLYIDRLIRGNEPPTAYVAGARNGLLKVERMND